MKNPKKRHIKKMIAQGVKKLAAVRKAQRLQQLVDTAVHLDPMNHCKTASRLGMLPTLTSQTPLTSQEAYDVLYGAFDAEFASTMDKAVLPLGLSDPSRAKDRDHTKMAIKATPEMKAEMELIKDQLKPIFVNGVRVDNPEGDKE